MKAERLGDIEFRCAGNSADILTIFDGLDSAGFNTRASSVYLTEPDLTAVIKRLKKIRKRIRAREAKRMGL